MAKSKTYTKGQPECTPFSLSKKSVPSGSPEGIPLSARKVLGKVGGSPSTGSFSLANKSVK